MDYPEVVDDCRWCGGPVFETDDTEAGDDGEGLMHADCEAARCDYLARLEARTWAEWAEGLDAQGLL